MGIAIALLTALVSLLLGVVIIYTGFLRSHEVFGSYRLPFRRRAA